MKSAEPIFVAPVNNIEEGKITGFAMTFSPRTDDKGVSVRIGRLPRRSSCHLPASCACLPENVFHYPRTKRVTSLIVFFRIFLGVIVGTERSPSLVARDMEFLRR